MTRIPANTLTIILAVALILGSPPAARPVETQSLVEGNTAFALNLYGQLKAEPSNLFFSPYSVSSALAMTYAGARGETEKQTCHVLHFANDQRRLHAAFGQLQRQLSEAATAKGIELSLANALWAQKDYPFRPAFLEIAKRDYQTNIAQADFKTAAEAARGEINHWVAQRTRDRIQDILPPGSLLFLGRLADPGH